MAVESMKLYLEGPGQERRPVRLISTEQKSLGAARDHPVRGTMAGFDGKVEMNTLMDEDGNLAQQIDREGFRYKFEGSEIPWSLIVG